VGDSLIDQLYTSEECKSIQRLYDDDPTIHRLLYKAFAERIISKGDIFLTSKPLDILCFICMSSDFADSELECQTVAIAVYNNLKTAQPLPSLIVDSGLVFAEKTLISLSFFRDAMKKRTNNHGAPKPEYYRTLSKKVFAANDLEDVAKHHEKWENFLQELFLV